MKTYLLPDFEQSLNGKPCPKCNVPTLFVADSKGLIDDLAELAEETGTDVEIISVETEEGQMLKDSFGGIAAVLRYKSSS